MLRHTVTAAVVWLSIGFSAQADVKLEHRPQRKEGQKATELTNTIVTQVLTLAGMDLESNVEQFMQISEVAGKRAADGSQPVKQKFDVFRMQMDLPNNIQVNFDSARPDEAKSDLPQLQEVIELFKAIAVAKWTAHYNADNRIEKIEYDGDPFANIAEALKSEVETDRAKQAANQVYDRLPGKVVKSGESWKRTEKMPIGSGQTLEFEQQFTYEGPTQAGGKTLHKITEKALSVKYTAGDNQPIKVTGSELKIESTAGHMLYDPQAGILTHLETKVRITGKLQVSIGGQDLEAPLDLIIESRTDVQ